LFCKKSDSEKKRVPFIIGKIKEAKLGESHTARKKRTRLYSRGKIEVGRKKATIERPNIHKKKGFCLYETNGNLHSFKWGKGGFLASSLLQLPSI